MQDERASWFVRAWKYWDWNAANNNNTLSIQTNGTDKTNSTVLVDLGEEDNENGTADSAWKRKNAVRKSRIQPSRSTSRYYSKLGRPSTLPHADIETPTVTIFELYHPWKNYDVEKSILTLSPFVQPIFQTAISGDLDLLKKHLSPLGNLEIPNLVNVTDKNGLCPLHIAAIFRQPSIASLLLDRGANPNALDKTGNISPLMCAAVSGNVEIMRLLVGHGVFINYGLEAQCEVDAEPNTHTALSWAVKAGQINSVRYLLENGALLSGTAINWETPIHEAAYYGNLEILKLFVHHERSLQILELRGGKNKNTALHIAVEQGHLQCSELLLSLGAQPDKMNIHGQSCLHLAAIANDFEAMKLLLKYGADVNAKDTRDRRPIHNCIQFSTLANHLEAMECVEILLAHDADINAQDENGMTPFHTAVDNSISTIVAILLKQGADLTLCNRSGQSAIEMLVKKMPHALRFIKESLDFAISVKHNDVYRYISDPDCTLTFDFRPIMVSNYEPVHLKLRKETELLLSFCAFGHNEILAHPLIEAFLTLKWERMMKYFWASFIGNILMVVTYSFFVVHLYGTKCPLKNLTLESNPGDMFANETLDSSYLEVVWYFLLLMLSVFMTKELIQLYSSPKSYFKGFENYAQLLFVALAIFSIFPHPLGPIRRDEDLCKCLTSFQLMHYRSASVSVVVAWLLILLRIGKLPKLGLYVQMLFKVVVNFGKFIITYVSIMISFSLAFGIILDERPAFNTIFHSFLSTLVMMTGEINEENVIPLTQMDKPLPYTTYIIFTLFVLLVTVVLMNLLIGLAVSDIQGLREGAKVARLSRLVIAISQLESMLFSNGFINLLPKNFLHGLRKNSILIHKENMYLFSFRPHDPRDTTLPHALKLEALQILERRENEKFRIMKKNNQATDYKQDFMHKMEKLEAALESIQNSMQTILSSKSSN